MKTAITPPSYIDRYINFLLRQFHEICTDGMPALNQKLANFFKLLAVKGAEISFLLLSAPWAIPPVLLIRCLRPWRTIRLGAISNQDMGHFAFEVGLAWALRQQATDQSLDLYWFSAKTTTCNDFWAKMVRRNFLVLPSFLYSRLLIAPIVKWKQIMPGAAIHHIPDSWQRPEGPHDINGWLQKNQSKMPFLPEEDNQAKGWLRRQGWQDGEPIVCLLVRDSAYLGEKGSQREFFFRNSDITTYVTAAEWLAEQGVWVLRMGKRMTNPMPTSHPRIIDYAFHPDKSDFLDIWLFAHCDLCISTGSGVDTVSVVYGRPFLYLNFTPLPTGFVSSSNAMHLPKRLLWHASATPLTWREYVDNSFTGGSAYTQQGIQIIDLTPEEILAAVQERWQRLQGTWVDTEEDRDRHHRFWEIFKSYPDFNKYHGWIHPEARVGSAWLRSMGDAFLA